MDLSAFAAHLESQDCQPLTVARYLAGLRHFARWYQASTGLALEPQSLTQADVRDYRAHAQVGGAAPATINARLAALRAWCRWLLSRGEISLDPAAHVRLVPQQRPAPGWLDRRQLAALEREAVRARNAAQTPTARSLAVRNHALLMLLAHSGLRVAEVTALRLDDLELGERSGWVRVRAGKGGKARRVPLNAEARRPLRDWLPVGPPAPNRAVFVDPVTREPLRPRAVQLVVASLARAAGVACTPHTLRHTFAKSLIDAGAGLDQVADLLGHSRLETTRLYTRPSERDLEQAVQRLEG